MYSGSGIGILQSCYFFKAQTYYLTSKSDYCEKMFLLTHSWLSLLTMMNFSDKQGGRRMEGLGKRKGLLLQCGLFESGFFTSLLIPEPYRLHLSLSFSWTKRTTWFLQKKGLNDCTIFLLAMPGKLEATLWQVILCRKSAHASRALTSGCFREETCIWRVGNIEEKDGKKSSHFWGGGVVISSFSFLFTVTFLTWTVKSADQTTIIPGRCVGKSRTTYR